MPDVYTDTTTSGYGGRIVDSIKGILFGIILFIASFGVLYWNEGRVDLSFLAKTAAEISSQTQNKNASLDGKLVSASGKVTSDQNIGDKLFLKPDNYIAVMRKVEMYSWSETSETQNNTNVGGSQTKQTTYTYTQKWTVDPESSADFKHRAGHENPKKSIENKTNTVTDAMIGVYHFDPENASLPDFSPLSLDSQNVSLSQSAILANSSYVFVQRSEGGTFARPEVGDLRVSYTILKPGFDGTLFGKLNKGTIDSYTDEKGNQLYRVFVGSREQAIGTLHSEFTTLLWILRLVGFLMMWFGLFLLFEPFAVLLDILPVLGTISRTLIGIVTLFGALILSVATIVISAIIHNYLAPLIALIIGVVALFIFFGIWKGRRASAHT